MIITIDIKGYIDIQVKEYTNNCSGNIDIEFNILCLAIACLNANVQNSFTGPLVKIELNELIPYKGDVSNFNSKILNLL